jgi:DNA-directed RNA polymerase specialized sigma24 family protein
MSKNLNEIVEAADWKELTPRLLYYADQLIRKCPWRGITVTARYDSKLCVEGSGADDFLQESLDRLFTGERAYNHSISLEHNLRGVIRSMIWSANKSSRRTPLRELVTNPGDDRDPLQGVPSAAMAPDAAAVADEQKKMLEDFEKSLSDDTQLLQLISAYKDGCFKPRDLERIMGLPATEISELKRKLRLRMRQFEARLTRRDNP